MSISQQWGWRRLATPPNTPSIEFHTSAHTFRVQHAGAVIADGFWSYAEHGLPRHRFAMTLRARTEGYGELQLTSWCREVLTRCAALRCDPELLAQLTTDAASVSPGMLDAAYDAWVAAWCPVPFYAYLGFTENAYNTFVDHRPGWGLPRGPEVGANGPVGAAVSE